MSSRRRTRAVHRPLLDAVGALQRLQCDGASAAAAAQAGIDALEPATRVLLPTGQHRRVCHICHCQSAPYTCPRCEAPYCSATCYKTHGDSCTEAFYRDQVIEELQGDRAGDDSKKHVASLLAQDSAQRVADAELLDAGANGSIHALETAAALLEDHNLNEEEKVARVLGALTREQQQSFARSISAGHLGGGQVKLTRWRPWWHTALRVTHTSPMPASDRPGETPLIVELPGSAPPAANAESTDEQDTVESAKATDSEGYVTIPLASSAMPSLPHDLPPLSTLLSGAPAPVLSVHMVELLYAYAYSKLLYNGDWGHTPQDALDVTKCMLQLSAVLSGSPQVESLECASDAVHSSLERSLQPRVFDSAGFSVNVLQSVIDILRLPQGPLCALSDAHAAFVRACKSGQPRKSSSGQRESKQTRRALRAAMHKLWFFVVWCSETGTTDAMKLNCLELAQEISQEAARSQVASTNGLVLRKHAQKAVVGGGTQGWSDRAPSCSSNFPLPRRGNTAIRCDSHRSRSRNTRG